MAVAMLLALIAPFLAVGLVRCAAILLLVCAAALIIGPILVLGYDYRYVVPAFGPLTGAAAIGGYGLWRLVARRPRPGAPAAGSSSSGQPVQTPCVNITRNRPSRMHPTVR